MLGLVVSVECAILLATHRTGKWPVNIRFFPTPALGWTLGSFVNNGIARLSGTTGIVGLSGITVFITWNSRLLVSVLFVQGQSRATGIPLATYTGRQGSVQTWVCVSSCQKHNHPLRLALHCMCPLQTHDPQQ